MTQLLHQRWFVMLCFWYLAENSMFPKICMTTSAWQIFQTRKQMKKNKCLNVVNLWAANDFMTTWGNHNNLESHNWYMITLPSGNGQHVSKQLPSYISNNHRATLACRWSHISVHSMKVSPIFTLLCALLASPIKLLREWCGSLDAKCSTVLTS